MSHRKPLYFTFANHMHWVDMQWLWGYHVLPESIRDMLRLCAETGARGNVNFDAVGYEKLAAEDPEALALLRAAVQDGRVEVVGASYGQPYGLFNGPESNIRQRVLGVRACLRLFGTRPRAFWEEEFDFHPQLPQMLAGCGFECASLFFQWTWHTPEVPVERVPLVLWQGIDGTRLPALARTELCLHQWPEDFEGRLDSPLVRELATPALVQWVELLPSPDWMCRSEVLLPRLRELFHDDRFELRPRTLSPLVAELRAAGDPPPRAYTLDDVFHGVSLGKNGDHVPRLSLRAEEQILCAESLSALCGLLGRPYPSWDVYPSWELDEAWRELCAAQHHDNHECEGLCGSIGEHSFRRAQGLANDVLHRSVANLAARVPAEEGETLVYNPCGWPRDVHVAGRVARAVPAFGYALVGPRDALELGDTVEETPETLRLSRGATSVTVCRRTGRLLELTSAARPEGVLLGRALGELTLARDGRRAPFADVETLVETDEDTGDPVIVVRRGSASALVETIVFLARAHDGVHLSLRADVLERPDGGMNAGLQWSVPAPRGALRVRADSPYAVAEVHAGASWRRKYPRGDWMTSEQWFETVERPFTAQSLVDLCDDAGAGLLVLHDGSQQWFREGGGVRCLLDLYDPWDEEHYRHGVAAELALLPHGPLRDSERWRLAREHCVLPLATDARGQTHHAGLPRRFGPLVVRGEGVVAGALYRECAHSARHLPSAFDPAVRNPFVLRLVELDGCATEALVDLPGAVARAARTNLMGEVVEELAVETVPAPDGDEGTWSRLRLHLAPHAIATVMADLVLGRHLPRNLDQHRAVWATVHR